MNNAKKDSISNNLIHSMHVLFAVMAFFSIGLFILGQYILPDERKGLSEN